MTPGTRIGAYHVIGPLGAGGMGEVYRARDAKLDRDVAIKILPTMFASDGERLARFQREARTLATLNHPNIAAIYGLEDTTDVTALVLELVEGPTLADRISQGPLPVDEALAIARQTADALTAAHEHGIVHRDLKPANIKLRPDGVVKVLDFGLAKALEGASAASPGADRLAHSPTITSPAMTAVGVLLGTAAYMSPEQARGRPVDRRADIWAFGCLLYEMLTARRAFLGDDVSLTLAKVLERDVDLDRLPPTVPARVRQAIHLCLRKDPKQRIGDIRDVVLALDGAFETASLPLSAPAPATRSAWRLPAAAILAVTALGVALWLRPAPYPEVVRFQIHAPPGSRLPLGTPAVSPDGRMLAYTVVDSAGVSRIHVRPIDRVETRVLPGTEDAVHPFWSPDGRSLAFATFSTRQVKRIDVDAGRPQTLAEDVSGPWHGTWNQHGDILYVGPTLARVFAGGGPASPVVTLDDKKGEYSAGFPFFLADGQRFLIRVASAGGSSIQLGRLGSTERTMLIDGIESAPMVAMTPRGRAYLLFLRDLDLMAQEFDAAAGRVRGDPLVLLTDVGRVANPAYRPALGVSRSGILAFQSAASGTAGPMTWVDRSGAALGTIPADAAVLLPAISPDGAFVAGQRAFPRDLWITDLARGSSTRITSTGEALRAVWSPDGQRLAFRKGSGAALVVLHLETLAEQPLGTNVLGSPASWSPDGRYVLHHQAARTVLIPADGTGQSIEVGSPAGPIRDGDFSPDGRYIAVSSSEAGREEVFVQQVPPGTRRWKVSVSGGQMPRWRRDGRELFFVSLEGAMMAADVMTGDTFSSAVPRELFRTPTVSPTAGYDVTADGQRFLLAASATDEDAPITVVMNWWVELERRSR